MLGFSGHFSTKSRTYSPLVLADWHFAGHAFPLTIPPGSQDPEGLATFFVALSRAKKRANFTYCRQRGGRERIAELFELLQQAGVPETEIADWR